MGPCLRRDDSVGCGGNVRVMTEVDDFQAGAAFRRLHFAALVGLVDDPLVEDADRADHQQAKVCNDIGGKRFLRNVIAFDI